MTPSGLLVCRDLIFTTKIGGTAQALGLSLRTVASEAQVRQALAEAPPRVLLLDLSSGEPVRPEAIRDYRSLAPATQIIAFGSHVDAEALEAARQAGCHQVMPRSKFVNELPDLLRSHLADEPA